MKIAYRMLVSLATALALSGVLTGTPTQAQAKTQTQAAFPWPSVNPSAEVQRMETDWTQQQAIDWVNACTPGRFCTWIREHNNYHLFQFYRCQVYALSRWTGISDFYNHQTVRVELLGSRHEHIRYLAIGDKFITNWNPVFFINLCA